MRAIIPYNEDLNHESIVVDFMLKYYPEMTTSAGKLFFWFGPKYAALEKNVFVYDYFIVKQKERKGETRIRTLRGQSRWLGLPFVNYFVCGDFYEDVNNNFKRFLLYDCGYKEEDIIIKISWWEKYGKFILMWLGLNIVAFLITGVCYFLLEETQGIRVSNMIAPIIFAIGLILANVYTIWKVVKYVRKSNR